MISKLITGIIIAGTIQGFVFAIAYLFSKKYKGTNTFYLAALIFAFSYNNLQFLLPDTGMISGRRMYETFYIPVGSLIPVFVYFYVLVFLNPSKKIKKKLRLLFVPFFVFLFFIAIPFKIEAIQGITKERYSTYRFLNGIQSSFSLLYTLVLLLISFITVVRFKKNTSQKRRLKITPSDTELTWLQNTLLILFVLTCFWAFALITFFSDPKLQFYFRFLWLGLSFAIYYLGHFGIYKYGITKDRKKIREATHRSASYSIEEKPKQEKSTSQNEHIVTIKTILIQEKRYLDSNLSLETLADELQLSKSYLSRIINHELGTSFSEYINSLRVEEAKTHLRNPEFSRYTVVAIGLEAGFNSKTTFNNAFKKFTGLTPSQFRKNPTN
ncbi:helix-turn-helix domain-containing protein [Dokdonia sp.]|uniref:helix-turn-helix domain-containing protein n=1 Tax=Dokdonia sp. TaxID=2024995 RepID=UPI003263BCBF